MNHMTSHVTNKYSPLPPPPPPSSFCMNLVTEGYVELNQELNFVESKSDIFYFACWRPLLLKYLCKTEESLWFSDHVLLCHLLKFVQDTVQMRGGTEPCAYCTALEGREEGGRDRKRGWREREREGERKD